MEVGDDMGVFFLTGIGGELNHYLWKHIYLLCTKSPGPSSDPTIKTFTNYSAKFNNRGTLGLAHLNETNGIVYMFYFHMYVYMFYFHMI